MSEKSDYPMEKNKFPRTRSFRRQIATLVAIVGGIMLLISGTNGVSTMETLQGIITLVAGEHQLIIYTFIVLIIIAALGGLSVICGGILIWRGRVTPGKILIFLGAGGGLIGLLINIIPWLVQEGAVTLDWVLDLEILGLILSVAAQKIAK